ncbi:hypothetical protein K449DRAFT_434066 [Hypoxylon sp. EC38]|nr:hypothetical protein K449DRAFT_434066 [Hypoxylon sp. EC38]
MQTANDAALSKDIVGERGGLIYAPNPGKKIVPPRAVATSNLPNSGDGFASISILTPNKTLNIENDRIASGSTAYFNGDPDLEIDEYDWLGERHR